MLVHGAKPDWVPVLNAGALGVETIRAVLNRELVKPIRKGLVGSDTTIRIDCICGEHLDWRPPHREWETFCSTCGSRLRPLLVDENVGDDAEG